MEFGFKTIESLEDFSGKRALVRVDFNVPLKDGKVDDDFRIRRSVKTVDSLLEGGAKVILISHMSGNEVNSLKSVRDALPRYWKTIFAEKLFGKDSEEALSSLEDGQVLLFENLRVNSGEKNNDPQFAENLASMGDFFVNEAFSASHRKHASIIGIPEHLPSFAGILFEEEVKNLSKALDPEHPFVFILGGAKFDTKIPLALRFSGIADHVFVGGAISNEFFEEMGMEIGDSLSSPEFLDTESLAVSKVILPADVKVLNGGSLRVTKPGDIKKGERIVDIGPKTVLEIKEKLKGAQTVLWNGPLGEYKEGYKETSLEVARAIVESGAPTTITGGGDTLSAISDIKVEDKFSFVSTAGGAMLEFLAKGTLPGIEALEQTAD